MFTHRICTRFLAVLCAFALLLPLLPAAQAASYPYDVVSMENVNMRSSSNTTSAILKKIKAGDTVTILGVRGSYYKVKAGGKTGYCQKQYIDGTSPTADQPVSGSAAQAAPAISTYPYDTTVIANVKLRKTDKTTGEVYVLISAGSIVKVLGRTGTGFAKVKYNGRTGYAAETHINLADIPVTEKETAQATPGSEKYTELKIKSTGSAVTALQSALAELGYLTEKDIDGKFGTKTESALKTFQKRNGLTQNGIASAELQLKLYEGTPKDYRGYRQYVKTVAPVAGALIRAGGKGEAVTRLQVRLKELGYYDNEINGVFDEETVAAFKMFEGRHGLNADGEASAEDQEVLYGATAMAADVFVVSNPTNTVPFTETLRKGSKGANVQLLQTRLQELGYYSDAISGTFDDKTVSAVKAFQKNASLEADGVCGPITRTALFGVNAIAANGLPVGTVASEDTEVVYEPITADNVIVIRAGSRGEIVLRLQKRLEELGYYTSRKDGVYLTDDIEAVRAFQKMNGLTVDGTAGLQTQTALYSDTAIGAAPAETAQETTASSSLRYGDEGTAVTNLQKRLITLGYLAGSADGKFGTNTKKAVIAFQKANKLTADGVVGAGTSEVLYSSSAVANNVDTDTVLRIGSVSEAVKTLQTRLITLGYFTGKADGIFGTKTSLAVIAFQKANSLKADGIAGTKTLAKLNSTSAKTASGTTVKEESKNTEALTVTSATISASMVRYANWYTEVKAKCKLLPNVTLYDFTTGISWSLNIFSLGAHADAEPLTAKDTANMNRAFGGQTTWTPKAVWCVFSDGTVYMATTHNTPHEVQHNRNNNFAGHLCIHFPRTQEQVEKIGPYATSHQKAVELGWQATQKLANK